MASSRRSKEVSFTISNHPEMHPDLKKANQNDFWAHVKSVLATRKSGRNKKGGPQLPTFIKNEYDIQERIMTASDVKREARLKNIYDKSEMKASMISQYGPEKGKQIYFATIRKQAMGENYNSTLTNFNKKGEDMTRSYQATKEDFELWIQNVLEEGYDLSDLTIDELYDIYEELIEDESEYSRIHYVSPYKSINESVEEESELSPYDYWKNFIVEEDEDDDEDEEDDDDELEEEVELTPYELWKLYALQKNIQEQGEDEEEDKTSYNVTVDQIKKRQKQQRKRQIAAQLRDAADEVERD